MAYTTINKSSDYFNTKLYTGNNTSTHAITGVGFQPDWTWIKVRNTGDSHRAFDAVRGSSYYITPNATVVQNNSYPLTSFDSDGFTIGSSDTSVNGSYNYVSWNWKANGSGSSNSDGSITATVSANTTAGFSIVKWTGSGADGTIGHGLGVAPKMVIVKSLANTTAWMVYHASLGNNKEIYFNATNAEGASTAWNTTTPTSSVISLDGGSGNGVNYSADYLAYCFAEKTGFSKFGSYTGNGNDDGPFIYTGFKPAFVMIKSYVGGTGQWLMFDNKRNDYNVVNKFLKVDDSAAEGTGSTANKVDFCSNGIKIRENNGDLNLSSSVQYLYMAFAEAPLVGSNNIPATAR